ncbi:MAG: hypothetical protein R3E86_08985 [Pseudomonadales bacterium]
MTILAGALGAAVLLAGLAAPADARVSTSKELAGYHACLDAAADSHSGLVAKRFYYTAQSGDNRTYYINASAWENGNRVALRIACATSTDGRELLSVSSAEGRYALADEARHVQFAAQ